MSVRLTTDENVCAMYDSTSGHAFGPVFDTGYDAQAFLDWLAEGEKNDAAIDYPGGGFKLFLLADPRKLDELDHVVAHWKNEVNEAVDEMSRELDEPN